MINECWLWTGSLDKDGYGRTTTNNPRRTVRVHRASYEVFWGPIPKGFQVDHTCHDPKTCPPGKCYHRACYNPWHLEAVTNKENINRGGTGTASKTCIHGFAKTSDCLECKRAKDLRSWRKRKGTGAGRGNYPRPVKTHCPRGHLYSGVNSQGCKICHTCLAAMARRYRKNQK